MQTKVMGVAKNLLDTTIAKAGDPILYQKAQGVDFPLSKPDHENIKKIVEVHKVSGGLALAAPQVRISKRIVVMEVPQKAPHPRYDFAQDPSHEAFPFQVMINPDFEALSAQTQLGFESCLSYPGYRGQVERFTHISCVWSDLNGNRFQKQLHGFNARVFQHEFDHLNGITYVQRIKDFRTFACI